MGTRRNLANLASRSGATCRSAAERDAVPPSFWIMFAPEKMAIPKTAVAPATNRGHLEGMAGAFYQSFALRRRQATGAQVTGNKLLIIAAEIPERPRQLRQA